VFLQRLRAEPISKTLSHGEWDVKLNAKGAEEDAKGAMESLSPTVRML
jgi:hypothetical protein